MLSKSISPAIQLSRRFGFVAKGFVYLIVGFLAAKAAIRRGGDVTDEQGALHQVLAAPFGRFLLGIAAVGLFVYAAWRLFEMWSDPEKKGKLWRFQSLLSGFVYAGLGVEAMRMALSMRSSGGGESEAKEQAAFLISVPFGHWLTVALALIGIAFGFQDLWRAVEPNFEDRNAIKGLSRPVKPWVLRIARLGIFSRGLVSTIVGFYMLLAGIHRSPSEARGTKGAIESLGQQPMGEWILVLIAIGITAYGVYTLVEARYRELAT